MTFSLVARCAETGMFGLAVSSSSPAVAARCAFARAGVGAVSTQNITDPTLGPVLLDMMGAGVGAQEALSTVCDQNPLIGYRQLLAVDQAGATAAYSGEHVLGVWGQAQARDVASAGNLLDHDGVPRAIVDAFLASSGHLGDRLVAALKGGLDAGGEAGPVHSAGLKIVDQVSWPVADLRCDWTEACPIKALEDLWQLYKPQLESYVSRALNPAEAPSYGVPGDE